MKAELNVRFKKFEDPSRLDFNPLFVVATALDPRFRLLLSEEQIAAAKKTILDKLCELREREDSPMDDEDAAQCSNGSNGELQPPLKRFKHLTAIVKEKRKEEKRKEKAEPAPEALDVENYFKTSYPTATMDSVKFWVERESTFPILAPFAIDLLIVPASSAPVERAFSTAGVITSGRRNRLAGHNLEREIFIKRNKKYL